MDATNLLALVAEQGGFLGLAMFALWMLNKTWEARLEEAKRNTENIQQMWECTKNALEENTKAVTSLLERIE